MPEALLVQKLGVSFQSDDHGVEGLLYSPAAILPEDPIPPRVFRSVPRRALRGYLANVFAEIDRLIDRAFLGQKRKGLDVRPPLSVLARHVFPEDGFFRVITPGVHPQFDIMSDIATVVPWEALEEWYLTCTDPNCSWPGEKQQPTICCCPAHGTPVQKGGGVLALDRHVSHCVDGGDSALSDGMNFLIIWDPLGDLCDKRSDREGRCAAHLAQLKNLLAPMNFRIDLLKGHNATRDNVVSALGNPSLGGVYYFGHGSFREDEEEGYLVLRDSTLSASDIADLNPRARFVFLNACEGAATGRTWTLGRRVRSVAEAFARGNPAKVVIAPIVPIVNTQAARAAIEFFESAAKGDSCGEALRKARAASYARYSQPTQDEPDISWIAYRYFGRPNRALLLPQAKKTPVESPGAGPAAGSRLFDRDDRLNTEVFGFAVADVLFRAAKRRKRWERTQATAGDFVLGLLRVGDLTRYMFGEYGVDCDEIYDQVIRREERAAPNEQRAAEGSTATGKGEAPAARPLGDRPRPEAADPRQGMERTLTELRTLISQFLIRQEADFHSSLLEVLKQADQIALRAPNRADRRVSEQDVLEAITAAGTWPADLQAELPPIGWVAAWLREREAKQIVDANGRLRLACLTAGAVRVVETAHALAQQRGISPIPNRLVLVAFFDGCGRYAAELCRRHGADPARLAELLLSLTRSSSPDTFVLSHASCQKAVLPMLERARRLQGLYNQTEVGEPLLFKAYCQVAHPAIKKLLLALDPPLRVDLDTLADEPLPAERETPRDWREGERWKFDPAVRQILRAAAQFAYAQGYTEIQPPHVFAGLVSEGSSVARALERRSTRPERLIRAMLLLVPPKARQESQQAGFFFSRSVEEILRRADVYARAGRRDAIAEKDLRTALLENPQAVVVQSLESLGLNWLVTEDFDASADAPS